MNPVIFALQFLSVAILIFIGIIWLVTSAIRAWNPKVAGDNSSILGGGAIGLTALAVGVLLAAVYGWIPGVA